MGRELEFDTRSAVETQRLGEAIGRVVEAGDVVVLAGDLGAGKTVLVRGLAQGLGAEGEEVRSPTFTLLHTYYGRVPLYHFDLYRLDSTEELFRLGFDEYLFGEEGVVAVEWGNKFAQLMPEHALWVDLLTPVETPKRRLIRLRADGPEGERLTERVAESVQELEGGAR